jgi:hypothetical protein
MRGSACEATAMGVTAIVDVTNVIRIDDNVTSRMESLLALLAGRFIIGCSDGKWMLTTGSQINVGGGKRMIERTQVHAC